MFSVLSLKSEPKFAFLLDQEKKMTSTAPVNPKSSSGGLSTGPVFGISFGGAAVLVVLSLVLILCKKKRRRDDEVVSYFPLRLANKGISFTILKTTKFYAVSTTSSRPLHTTISMSWWAVIMVISLLGSNCGFCYPQQDLVARLPGQPDVSFRQFAGYVNVDIKNGRSLFYYYVEAEKQSDTKPLTLWLNGGPGCSSIGGGAFTELGPFYPTGDGRGLRMNTMSWNKVSNMLFVESPAGVGWSYSNKSSNYKLGDESTARDMLVFLLRWFNKFPELKSRSLFLAGESYAGHFIPQLADLIINYNLQSTGFKFNIKGIAIGNPLLRLNNDFQATYEFFWSHGMISDELRDKIRSQCFFKNHSFVGSGNVSKGCIDAKVEASFSISDYVNNYDILIDLCYPSLVQQELTLKKMATKMSYGVDVCMSYERKLYFNLPEVQHALHANRTHLPYEWSMCTLLNYSVTDKDIDMLPVLKKIIKSKIPVWIFSGDQDSVIPLSSSRTLVRELAHDLKLNITIPYGAWFHKEQVGGWTTEYGNLLTFATVRGAAHMVPYSQPSRSLHMFSWFVRDQRLPNKRHYFPYE